MKKDEAEDETDVMASNQSKTGFQPIKNQTLYSPERIFTPAPESAPSSPKMLV
jgi:hypothetical protein